MFKKFSLNLVCGLLILNPIAQVHASIEAGKEVVIETQAKAFTPAITLKNVYGAFSDVTSVQVHLVEADLNIVLEDRGNRTWEANLNDNQIKDLLGDKKSEEYTAKIITKSKNDKGRVESKEEIIKILIKA